MQWYIAQFYAHSLGNHCPRPWGSMPTLGDSNAHNAGNNMGRCVG